MKALFTIALAAATLTLTSCGSCPLTPKKSCPVGCTKPCCAKKSSSCESCSH